jgi:WD repeat-containing protein 90
VEERRDLNSK